MNLAQYETQLENLHPRCRWCGTHLPSIVSCYDHEGGYNVDGYSQKQWLYVTCVKCDYQWSFRKLGIRE